MSTDPMHRPLWRGRTNVDALTIQAIEAAEKRAGFTFSVTQGSYQDTVAASAGTHDGGGVVDLSSRYLSASRKTKMVRALREVGFAAWLRTPSQGPWVEHVHAVLVDHPLLSPSAARQVVSYRSGRNGLANNAVDDGPRISPIPVWSWRRDDTDLIAALVDARKATHAAVVALRTARRAVNRAAVEARKAGRTTMARNLVKRRRRLNNRAQHTVAMRKWLNGRAARLRNLR